MSDRKQEEPVTESRRTPDQVLDADKFRELVEEGQRLRRRFDRDSAAMRILTPDDLKVRSR